jgi:FkbM family methyltransferase
MNRKFIELARSILLKMGIDARRYPLSDSTSKQAQFNLLRSLRDLRSFPQNSDDERFLAYCSQHAANSMAQLMQDLFVLYELGAKRRGYFVEFGATDGVSINNTVLLEREFNWNGIVAEPAKSWHESLMRNRNCVVSTYCVWHTTGATLSFNETALKELSTIDTFASADGHAARRQDGKRYDVETISLNDLLALHKAPKTIDYLSVDTEGSEYEILRAFDFSKYDVRVLTVEHNYTANRERIFALLKENGFQRKFENLSQWDDWYVKAVG